MKLKFRRSLALGTTMMCFAGFALAYQVGSRKVLSESNPEFIACGMSSENTSENEDAATQVRTYQMKIKSLANDYVITLSSLLDSIKKEYTPRINTSMENTNKSLELLITNFYPTLELPAHLLEAKNFFLRGSDELTSIYDEAILEHRVAMELINKEKDAKTTVEQYKGQISITAQSYILTTSTFEDVVSSTFIPQLESSRDSSNSKLQSLITDYYPTTLSSHLKDALQFFINGSDELARIYYAAQIEQNKYSGVTDAAAKREINSYDSELSFLASKYITAIERFYEAIKTEYIPRIQGVYERYSLKLQNLITEHGTSGDLYSYLPDAREFFIIGSEELAETYNAATAAHTAIEENKIENENAKSKIESFQAKLNSKYNTASNSLLSLMDVIQEIYLPQLTEINNLYDSKLHNLIDLYYEKEQLANHLEVASLLYAEGIAALERVQVEAHSINESGGKSVISVELNPCESGTTNITKKIAEEGDTIFVHALLDPNYRFLKWTVNGDSVSSDSYMFMTVPKGYTTIIGFAEPLGDIFDESKSDDYDWEQHDGELTIRQCSPGNLVNKIEEALQKFNISTEDIKKCSVYGSLDAEDIWSFGILENCQAIDFKTVHELSTLPTSALNLNSRLTTLLLPASISSIGDFAFSRCSSLTHLYCYAETPPSLQPHSLQGARYDLTVWVPRKSVELYMKAEGWSMYNIQPLEIEEYEGFLFMDFELHNDKKIQIPLSEIPVISFDGEDICIQTTTLDFRYPISDFKKISYSNSGSETGIGNTATREPKYQISDRTIYFNGLQSNSILNVFTIDGTLVDKRNLKTTNGKCEYNINHLPSGIYLITIDDITCKILKK